MARDDLGRWVPDTSGNPGGMPKPPDGLRTRLAALSPLSVERLGELLDSDDERVRLEAARATSTATSDDQQSRPTSGSTVPRGMVTLPR